MSSGKDAKKPKKRPAPRRRTGKLATRSVEAAAKRKQALQLRMAGATFDEIAEAMSLTQRGVAYGLVKEALAETQREIREDADRYVAEEVTRLDRLIRAIWPLAIGRPAGISTTGLTPAVAPDLKAVAQVEKLIGRKSRLLGLDAPIRHELSGPGGAPVEISDAKQRLIDRLASLDEAEGTDEAAG